jgi:hypothetical protein
LCAANAEKNCFSYEKGKTSMIENTESNGDGQKMDPINYKILDQNRPKVSLVYPLTSLLLDACPNLAPIERYDRFSMNMSDRPWVEKKSPK